MDENVSVRRGQVWYLKYNDAIGFEEAVGRPAVVISTNAGIPSASTIIMAYMTTSPKNSGLAVEVFSTKKRSWVLCNQIISVDRRRIIDYLCDLTESEMAKIDVALRKALALPLKRDDLDEQLDSMSKTLALAKDRIKSLEMELAVQKLMFDKAVDKIAEMKFEKAIGVPKVGEVPKVEEIEKPLDLTGLTEKFKVYDERAKKKQTSTPVAFGDKVNVNTADWKTLVEKTGMGEQTAKQIIQYREKIRKILCHHRFTCVSSRYAEDVG